MQSFSQQNFNVVFFIAVCKDSSVIIMVLTESKFEQESHHEMTLHHIDIMNLDVSRMETCVCRQHCSMNNPLITCLSYLVR